MRARLVVPLLAGLCLVLAAACGHIGFDELAAADAMAPTVDATADTTVDARYEGSSSTGTDAARDGATSPPPEKDAMPDMSRPTADSSPLDSGGPEVAPNDSSIPNPLPDSSVMPDAEAVDAPPTFSIGGMVSGLAAGGALVLQDNGGSTLKASLNGSFTFAAGLPSGQPYAVTVLTQPTNPTQRCAVSMATGTVTGADVTNVAVTCTTQSYTVGGTLTGLASGQSLTLEDNSGNPFVVTNNGSFSFPGPVDSGSTYAVTVTSQPVMQTCTVSAGSGTVTSANVASIVVNCASSTYTVGGTVSGLASGDSLQLENNGTNDQFVATNGPFAFTMPLANGQTYDVTIFAQPDTPVSEVCSVGMGSGVVGSSDVNQVTVTCSLLTSCLAILQAEPSSPSGLYSVSLVQTAYTVYCDMEDGGYTEVFDQDITVAPGYEPAAAWLSGVNTSSPNSGQYSILNEIPNLESGPSYDFRIVWPDANAGGSVQWTQVENPLAAPQTPTISNVSETPSGQVGCGTFRGLAPSLYGQPAALHGDSDVTSCWFWAIGSSQQWNTGIPTYSSPSPGNGTQRAQLFVR